MIESNATIQAMRSACRRMPNIWDGRASIIEMKESGYHHWRQMEWMGWYFQFLCEREFQEIFLMPGKTYGRTEFDALGQMSWDFKAHAANTQSHTVIVNDTEAIENTLRDYGYYGLVLAIGEVEYNDEERTFKAWHDHLKGDMSAYEKKRINRGAMSRRRKTKFVLSEIHFICLNEEMLKECSGSFQKGFRNADGSPRRSKVTVNISQIPDEALVATESFQEEQ